MIPSTSRLVENSVAPAVPAASSQRQAFHSNCVGNGPIRSPSVRFSTGGLRTTFTAATPALEVQLDRIDSKGKTRFTDLELVQRLIFSAACWRFGRPRPFAGRIATAHGTSLADQFAEFLKDYGLHSPYVLRPDVVQGKYRYCFDFCRPFSDYMKAQGVPRITPHVMRHSFASIGASKGIDIYRIATWLGDDLRFVQRHYAKLRSDDREIMRAFKVSAEFTSVSPPVIRSMHASRS